MLNLSNDVIVGSIRFLPPGKDVNCLSTIPQQLIETSKESPIIIPRKDLLKDLNENTLACLYHRYLQTLQRHCTSPERIGNLKAGGWYMCTDPEAKPKSPCLVYSFRVVFIKHDERNYGSFASEMATNYKCNVSLYNPRIQVRTFINTVKISNLKLDAENGISVDYLNSELKKKSQNIINVLTLDVNDREWDVIPKLLKSGILAKTEQFLVRLHSSQINTNIDHYIKRLVVLRNLYDIGFRIFWSDRDIACLHRTKKVTGCYDINMRIADATYQHTFYKKIKLSCLMVELKQCNKHIDRVKIRIMNRPSPLVIPHEPEFSRMQPREYGELFVRYVTSTQIPCKELIRIGKIPDGGWEVCHDAVFRPRESCLVYSFGYKTIDILKMDVEGSEWESIPQMISSGAFKHVRQFAFEIHIQSNEDTTPAYKNGLILLRTLYDAGFRIFWNIINVLTLDINDREWDVIPQLLKSGILGKTEQFLVRLHSSKRNSSASHYIKRLTVLRNLYHKGFRIFWSDRDVSCLHKTKKATGCYYIYMVSMSQSVQIPCKELIRIGNLPDGGWEVCHDAKFRPRKPCLVYSFGINNDFSFDDDVANTYGCKVNSFDPSMKQNDHKHSEQVMFYATGISHKNGKKGRWKMRNFITILKTLGQKEENY
ncbi:hypothetical protein KUTeg_012958 [Tegillarca granosa]|uniref:Methyltransferase domain-containing protein n=1 Tax=Tegillarca granosa TaxID=220873 RepID=A0ABQ9ESQ7_TEGGR|nr:hypothetical protein KUTeg_012958 [Tegillarca granosa]